MRGKTILGAWLAGGMVAVAGCHHDQYKVKTPQKEECVLPPDEPRYNEAREEGYRKTTLKGKEKSGNDNNAQMGRMSPGGAGGGMGR